MSRSITSIIRRLGPRLSLRVARHGLQDQLLESDPWYDTDDTSDDPAIFIGGCGRSGTTLLRELVSRHSRIACGPESHILSGLVSLKRLSGGWQLDRNEVQQLFDTSSSIVRFAEAFFRNYAERQAKPRWADKSPGNVRYIHRLLSRFPNAQFVHIIRDGRDVVCSLRHHPRERIVDGVVVQRGVVNPIDKCARRWAADVACGLPFRGHPRYTEVRYEELVREPEATLQKLCSFLGEPFEAQMLQAGTDREREAEPGRWLNNANASAEVAQRSIGRWQKDLAPDERQTVVRIAGELLVTLGYTRDHSWAD